MLGEDPVCVALGPVFGPLGSGSHGGTGRAVGAASCRPSARNTSTSAGRKVSGLSAPIVCNCWSLLGCEVLFARQLFPRCRAMCSSICTFGTRRSFAQPLLPHQPYHVVDPSPQQRQADAVPCGTEQTSTERIATSSQESWPDENSKHKSRKTCCKEQLRVAPKALTWKMA